MTHPLRDPKGNGGRRKVKKGEPFDPEELSRRLTEHLVEQKLKAEKRREARALKAAALAQQTVSHASGRRIPISLDNAFGLPPISLDMITDLAQGLSPCPGRGRIGI